MFFRREKPCPIFEDVCFVFWGVGEGVGGVTREKAQFLTIRKFIPYFLGYKAGFSLPKQYKNLDLSYKTDLVFSD